MKIDRHALVTGASGGIGKAVVKKLLFEGYTVLGTYFENGDNLKDLVNDRFFGIALDFRSDSATETMVSAISAYLNRKVDLFVNCAGELRTGKLSLSESSDMVYVNLLFPYHLCMEIENFMSGNGCIILLSSISSSVSTLSFELYSATKAGVESLVRSFAFRLGPKQVTVIGIAPGLVNTKMSKSVFENLELYDAIVGQTPVGKLATVEEISEIIYVLSNDRMKYMTGQTIVLDGGRSLGSYERIWGKKSS